MEARSTMENAEDQRLLEQLQAASKSRGPHAKSIRSVIKKVLIQRGITDEQASLDIEQAWRENVSPALAAESRVGRLQRGRLTVWVANNLVLQEAEFSRRQILSKMQSRLPHLPLKNITFRVEG